MVRIAFVVLIAGCGAAETQTTARVETGTYEAADFVGRAQRPASQRRGLVARLGQVAIIEGDATMISGRGPGWGLVLDANRNDPGAVTARYASEVADVPAALVVFTAFDDLGSGGPAYYVPIAVDKPGTGRPAIDQRADFGTQRLTGFINMKSPEDHGAVLLNTLAHEIAHRDIAYMQARTGTTTRDLTGRQGAHWQAALHTSGSLLEGYGWRETEAGRFVVNAVRSTFSDLDLYGLGLLPAGEVAPFFLIEDARSPGGAAIPSEAQLTLGAVATGRRVDIDVNDVIAVHGLRTADIPHSPEGQRRVVFAVLTSPDQSRTSTAVVALAEWVDALRPDIEQRWRDLTRNRGVLCTRVMGCSAAMNPALDAGSADSGEPELRDSNCDCSAGGGSRSPTAPLIVVWLATRRRRGRSCDRSRPRGGRRRPKDHRPQR